MLFEQSKRELRFSDSTKALKQKLCKIGTKKKTKNEKNTCFKLLGKILPAIAFIKHDVLQTMSEIFIETGRETLVTSLK